MTVITHPDNLRFSRMSWGQKTADVDFESSFGSQSQEIDVPRWVVMAEVPAMYESQSGDWQAHILKLKGKKNALALWNQARPAPRGTMRGTMTLNASALQGATTLSIVASGENAKTLLKGDLLGLGSGTTQQVVMLTEDSTSNGSGVIVVTFAGTPLRNAFASGSAVTWNKPKALFRRSDSETMWSYETIMASGFRLNLIEDWR